MDRRATLLSFRKDATNMDDAAKRLSWLIMLSALLHAALLPLVSRMRGADPSPTAVAAVRSAMHVTLPPRVAPAAPTPATTHLPTPVRAETSPARRLGSAPAPILRPRSSAPAPPLPAPSPEPVGRAPSALPAEPAPPAPAATALLDAARRDAGRFARELNREPGAQKVIRSGRQARLDRDFDEAYAAAHRGAIADVTRALDGDDRVYRIRTPFGVDLCLNRRDLDRFRAEQGKATFHTVCNR